MNLLFMESGLCLHNTVFSHNYGTCQKIAEYYKLDLNLKSSFDVTLIMKIVGFNVSFLRDHK